MSPEAGKGDRSRSNVMRIWSKAAEGSITPAEYQMLMEYVIDIPVRKEVRK